MTLRDRNILFMHRRQARRVGRMALSTAFVSPPEPYTIGVVRRGQQLLAGTFLFSGLLFDETHLDLLIDKQHLSIWSIETENPLILNEIHGFGWLDDLAAIGTEPARLRAQEWAFDWINRFGRGDGPIWTPDIVGRRLIRLISHGTFLLKDRDEAAVQVFYRSLAQQMRFLSYRGGVAPYGLPRFEALVGTIYAGLMLEGMARHMDFAVGALAQDCAHQIDQHGGLPSRNPEELLEVLCLLNLAVQTLTNANRHVPAEVTDAVARIVPTLRGLRHRDGGLAQFHGGGRGITGRLDRAFAASGVRSRPKGDAHMGYVRLTGGRSSLIIDAASPPKGPESVNAHASTLAFELTSGRRPIIVNCGSGARLGEEWQKECRATVNHATLNVDGASSSQWELQRPNNEGQLRLKKTPVLLEHYISQSIDGRKAELSHDGYRQGYGLTHGRVVELSIDGRSLIGIDMLAALKRNDENVFGRLLKRSRIKSLPYSICFHLHPDVEPTLADDGQTVMLRLKSGENWVFSFDGDVDLALMPSVYLENDQLSPIETQQVVLSGHAIAYATRVSWLLAKTHDTPNAVRDLVWADPADAIIAKGTYP